MTAKEKLIRIVLNLSDSAVGEIFGRVAHLVTDRFLALPNEAPTAEVFNAAASATWDESKHPRDNGGQFTTKGAGSQGTKINPNLTPEEVKRWHEIGRGEDVYTEDDRRWKQLDKKLSEAQKEVDKWSYDPGSDLHLKAQAEVIRIRRQMAELERTKKTEERLKLEKKADKRADAQARKEKRELTKLVKQYHEVADEIDYMEEKYADRDPDSPTMWGLKFPSGKEGEKAKKRYEAYKKRLGELDSKIDWDKVDDEIDPQPQPQPSAHLTETNDEQAKKTKAR